MAVVTASFAGVCTDHLADSGQQQQQQRQLFEMKTYLCVCVCFFTMSKKCAAKATECELLGEKEDFIFWYKLKKQQHLL